MAMIEMNDEETSVYTSDIEEDRSEEDQTTRRKKKKRNAKTILHEVMSTLESAGSYGHLSLTHISKTQRPGDFSKDRVDQDMRCGAVLRDETCE